MKRFTLFLLLSLLLAFPALAAAPEEPPAEPELILEETPVHPPEPVETPLPEALEPSAPEETLPSEPAPEITLTPELPEPMESDGDLDAVPPPAISLEDTDSVGSDSVGNDLTEVTCSGSDVTITMKHTGYTSAADIDAAPSDTRSGINAVLVSLFGKYTHRTQTVTTYLNGEVLQTSTEYVPGLAGLDVEWLAGVLLFALMLYCIMRLAGGVLS